MSTLAPQSVAVQRQMTLPLVRLARTEAASEEIDYAALPESQADVLLTPKKEELLGQAPKERARELIRPHEVYWDDV